MLYSSRIAVSARCNRSLKFSKNNFTFHYQFFFAKMFVTSLILVMYIFAYTRLYTTIFRISSRRKRIVRKIHIIHDVSNIMDIMGLNIIV